MAASFLEARLRRIVDDRAKRQQLRCLDIRSSPQATRVVIDGTTFLNFSSNDYLSLSSHPLVREAAIKAITRCGVGSGASPLLSGRADYHAVLEDRLASFLGRQAALSFSSGYGANIGVVNGLVQRTDAVFCDRLIHASLIDAVRLTGASSRIYRHRDCSHLQGMLERKTEASSWIVTDGVFSMDGDISPLPDLVRLAQTCGASLIVDDAHGIGVIGATGRGSLEHCGLAAADVPVLLGTFGKAFGVSGAFVAGSSELIESLIQVARTYIYSTAPAPALAAATLASLDLVASDISLRARLHANIRFFRDSAGARGLPLLDSLTPIQPFMIGDDALALQVAQGLRARGIYARAIRPPTVPPGTSRLRICLNAAHTEEQIDILVTALSDIMSQRREKA